MTGQWLPGDAPTGHASPLSSFVGRARELDELEQLIASTRLVTVTGAGGSGKTRLALEVVGRLRPGLIDRAAFVDLGPLRDAALIPSAIAAALSLANDRDRDLLERVARRLDQGNVLLILDNLEQLLPDGALVAGALLERSPNVRVLATSRTPLGLRGEHAYPLDPLPVPEADSEGQVSINRLERNDAVALFLDRARAVNPRLQLSSENAPAIAAICRRLDGLPLALELAAARTRVLSAEALLRRLERALPILTSGPLDAPPRQRSLRATVRWTYDLLTPIERRVFARLSVFAGGARLDTASSVVGIEEADPELLDVFDQLVGQALTRVTDDADGEPRFTMLETIREVATEQLEADGDAATARRLHARAFVALAERAALDQMPLATHAWYERFDREHANLRAAIEWCFEHDLDAASRLVGLLYRFWLSRGHDDEARGWIESAVEGLAGDETHAAAGVVQAAAMLAYVDGRLPEAIGSAERAYDLSQRLGDRTGAAVTLLGLARISTAAGMPERARAAYSTVIRLADELDRPALKAAALANLGVLEMHEGRFREAADLARESLVIARRHGTLDWVAFAAEGLASAQVALGDYEGALASIRECLDAVHAFRGESPRGGFLLYLLAAVAAGIGEGRVGARLLPTGDRLMQRLGNAPEPFSGDLRRSIERKLRSRLGPAFEEAFESGRSLSVDQAIDEGLALAVPAARPGLAGPDQARGVRSRHDLTPRELEVLSLVAAGRSDGEIAEALFISKKTASVHVASIKDKLAAASRVEIALMGQRLGLTAPVSDAARHRRS